MAFLRFIIIKYECFDKHRWERAFIYAECPTKPIPKKRDLMVVGASGSVAQATIKSLAKL